MKYLSVRHPIFNNLAKELKKSGNEIYYISFSLSDLFYRNFNENYYVPKDLKNSEMGISKEELLSLDIRKFKYSKLYNEKIDEKEIVRLRKYAYLIEKYINEKKIGCVLIYNGSSTIEQILIYIAEKLRLQLLYLEEGYFRPYTITADTKGINYNSSIPRSKEFYDKLAIDEDKFEKFLLRAKYLEVKRPPFKDKIIKVLMKLTNSIGLFIGFKNEHKVNTLKEYLAREINLYKFKKMKTEDISLPSEYIFVPFQVHSDTQVLFHSPKIKDMHQLVENVVRELEIYNKKNRKDLKVIFKEHPMDIGRISYRDLYDKYSKNKNVIFLKKYDTKKLIKNSKLVITINSTVGIEALMNYKKVITLGNAFFNIEGLVTFCNQLNELNICIKRAIEENIDVSLINKFLYYLRFNYNLEGTWKYNNDLTIKNIIKKLEG